MFAGMSVPTNTSPVRITDVDVGRIVVETKNSFRVVRLAYQGRRVLASTHERITEAARRLGLPVPPALRGDS